MSEAQKHVCKFKKLKYKSGNEVFFCTLPDCSKKIKPALALGKKCICWRCGEEFILNEYSLRLVKPHCDKCHKSKDSNVNNPSSTSIIDNIPVPSLAERLQNTLQQAQEKEEDI